MGGLFNHQGRPFVCHCRPFVGEQLAWGARSGGGSRSSCWARLVRLAPAAEVTLWMVAKSIYFPRISSFLFCFLLGPFVFHQPGKSDVCLLGSYFQPSLVNLERIRFPCNCQRFVWFPVDSKCRLSIHMVGFQRSESNWLLKSRILQFFEETSEMAMDELGFSSGQVVLT